MSRPRGPVSAALLSAAEQGPATVRELAARAQVGYGAARYTASRLVDGLQLTVLQPGRPAVLSLPLVEPEPAPHHAPAAPWPLPASPWPATRRRRRR